MTEGSPGGAHYPQPQTFHVSQIKPEHSSPLCPLSNPSPPAWLIDFHLAGIVQWITDVRRCSCGHQFLVNWEGQHMFFHHACFSRSVLGWSAVPSYPPATYQLLWKWLHLIPKWSSLLCHSFSYLWWQHTSNFVINVFFDCVLTTCRLHSSHWHPCASLSFISFGRITHRYPAWPPSRFGLTTSSGQESLSLICLLLTLPKLASWSLSPLLLQVTSLHSLSSPFRDTAPLPPVTFSSLMLQSLTYMCACPSPSRENVTPVSAV